MWSLRYPHAPTDAPARVVSPRREKTEGRLVSLGSAEPRQSPAQLQSLRVTLSAHIGKTRLGLGDPPASPSSSLLGPEEGGRGQKQSLELASVTQTAPLQGVARPPVVSQSPSGALNPLPRSKSAERSSFKTQEGGPQVKFPAVFPHEAPLAKILDARRDYCQPPQSSVSGLCVVAHCIKHVPAFSF